MIFKDKIEPRRSRLLHERHRRIVLGPHALVAEKVGKRDERSSDSGEDGWRLVSPSVALVRRVALGRAIKAACFLGWTVRPPRFSFLLSIPAVVLSGLLELGSILSGEEGQHVSTGNLVLATLLAFVTGYAAIAWMLRYLTSHSTIVFVVYRVALGTLVLVLVAAGAIK